MQQIIEEAASTIRITKQLPSIAKLAREAGVSRKTLYKYAADYLAKAGEPATTTTLGGV